MDSFLEKWLLLVQEYPQQEMLDAQGLRAIVDTALERPCEDEELSELFIVVGLDPDVGILAADLEAAIVAALERIFAEGDDAALENEGVYDGAADEFLGIVGISEDVLEEVL